MNSKREKNPLIGKDVSHITTYQNAQHKNNATRQQSEEMIF